MKVAWPGEVLADQLRADDLILDDETPAGLAREQQPAQGGHGQREDDTAEEGQCQDTQDCRAELPEYDCARSGMRRSLLRRGVGSYSSTVRTVSVVHR
jgi:hypothetical protein